MNSLSTHEQQLTFCSKYLEVFTVSYFGNFNKKNIIKQKITRDFFRSIIKALTIVVNVFFKFE